MKNKITKVKKRTGEIVDFDQERITNAIFKALTATGQGDRKKAKRLSNRVVEILNRRFKKGEIPEVEQIQDIVEEILILEGLVNTARAYILYREQRRRIREAVKVAEEAIDRIDQYLEKLDWEVQENANMAFSLQGLNHYGVSYIVKKYWLNKIYPREIRETNQSGDLHIHNLDTLATYCAGWDLYDLLLKGFGGVKGKIESKPAKHFNTALMQVVNFMYTVQGETAGAIAFSNFDTLLAPFIRYDNLNYRQVKQALQEFLFNMAIPTRVGFQSLAWDEPVIIKYKGKIKFTEIGSLIDEEFKKNPHRIIEQHPKSYAIQNYDDYQVLSFDSRGRAVWAKVKAFIRHKVPKFSQFLKVRTSRGEATVSPAHSLFAFEKFNGKFNPRPVSASKVETACNYRQLNSKNHFLALKSLKNKGEKEELDLFRILDELPQLHKKIFVKINPIRTVNRVKENIFEKYQGFLPFWKNFDFHDRGTWKSWLKSHSIRYDIWRKFGDSKKNVELRFKNNNTWYPRFLKGKNLTNFIKLCAWYLTEGHTSLGTPIYLSQGKKEGREKNYHSILTILKELKALGQIEKSKGFSKKGNRVEIVYKISGKGLLAELISWSCGIYAFNKVVPWFIFELSPRYQKIFIETLLKGDAFQYPKHWDYSTTSKKLSLSLSLILAQNNIRFSVYTEELSKKNKNWRDRYIIRIYKDSAQAGRREYKVGDFEARVCFKKEKIKYNKEFEYDISVDLPQENFVGGVGGLVFHNTPFSNITLDLKPSPVFAKLPVIIGGKPQDKTYSEFEEEMKIFDKALYEVYMEGDAKGRPFHFPIPTINVIKDFPWDEPAFDGIFKASAKYGINYFANYLSSEMRPEDVRSMCLDGNEEILIRNSKKIKRAKIEEVAEEYKLKEFDKEGWAECKREGNLEILSLNPKNLKLEWSPIRRFLKIKDREGLEITTEDGKKCLFSLKHPMAVYTPDGIKMKFAKDIQKGDYLLTLKKANGEVFSKEYQKVENLILNEDLAKILGYFVADGNYLFESRKGYTHFGEPRGLQFSFKTGDLKNLNLIKSLIKKVFGVEGKEKQDPRYKTYYLYIYHTEIARKLYKAGFRKYGRLPQVLFNSPESVIKSFLHFYFKGDGYEKRKEIHLNDLELSRDLVLLFSLVGQPVTYKLRKRSQRIYLQHSKSKIKKGNGRTNNPILAERVPGWMAVSTTKVPGLVKSRMVGFDTVEKYSAHTSESLKIKNSDIYLIRVKEIKTIKYKQLKEFYDVELEKNHLFVHSLGQISFNCCRLRLDLTELYNRGGGGLFGSGSLTGSIGVVTCNLPRIGYLSKTKKEFFERLGKVMDLAKASLEIKRKAIENFMEKGLYPYSRVYLQGIKKMRGKYFANHFSTIGLVGMNEALLNFLGENIASKRGRKFALEVLDFMRKRLVKYQKETGNIYNLEATPAESSLAPNEKVLIAQSDPKLKEIGPLIDQYLEKNKNKIQIVGKSEILPLKEGELYTYGFSRKDQKIRKYPVTALIRHPGDSMYQIETASGRKIRVTKYHSVFTINEEGIPSEVKVENLKKGDPIAIPKRIEMENGYSEFNLIEKFKTSPFRDKLYIKVPLNFLEKLILNEKVENWAKNYYGFDWRNVKYCWKKSQVLPYKLICDLNISLEKEILKNSKIFYREAKNTFPTKVIIRADKNLGFVLGSLLAEGWIESDRMEFANTNKKIIEELAFALKEVFGEKSCHLYSKRGYRGDYVLTLNKMVSLILREIFGLRGKGQKKSIPSFVYFSPEDLIKGFLKGFALGDGSKYSNKKKSNYTYRLYTNSKKLMEGLNILLLRLGILAKIRIDKKEKQNPKWKRNYILSISGIENLKKFYTLVVGERFEGKLINSGREIIPKIAKSLKALFKKYGLRTKDLKELKICKDSFNRNARLNRISSHYLKEVLEKIEGKINAPLVRNLKVLIGGNLYWDPIKSIRKIKTPKYVYDFEVNVKGDLVENFLGGQGLVCLHNTAYRLALKDKEKYPDIITAGTKKVPFYTNSTQLPVNFTDDIFEALKLQDELQCKYTGGCIEKGNKVLTDKGLIKIEEIVKNFEKLKPIKALSYNQEKGISEWDEILEAVTINVKKHNKIRIKGERNLDITTSDWHPFLVLERFKPNPACPICEAKIGNLKAFAAHIRWNPECKKKYEVFPKYQIVEKRADELKVGDYILQNSSNLYPEQETELNNDLMWLIGFFIGDGHISGFIDNRGGNNLLRYKVHFSSQSQKALEKVAEILNKYFNCNVKVIKNDKRSDPLREVTTSKKEVSDFFFKYGFWPGEKVYNIYVPEKVKENLTKENVYSFLSGLMDSDGSLGKRNGDFEYQTVSPRLAEDILEICTLAGITISKSLKKTKRENEVDIWRLRIPQYELTKLKEKLTITVNPERIKNKLFNRKKRYLPVVRVKKVSKVDVKNNQFYDLMTRKNHNYLAGKDCLVFIHNTVLHLFLGERVSDAQSVKRLIKKIFENFRLPYLTLTPTFSICPHHGYLEGEHFECPKCTVKQPCEVYSRIVGYLRPVSQWNLGKQEEFKQRKEFKWPQI